MNGTETLTSFEATPGSGAAWASLWLRIRRAVRADLQRLSAPLHPRRRRVFAPPLCPVGAAEFAPPASGTTALFSAAIEFAVFSSPRPVVAAGDVVQAVSGF